MIVNVKRVFPIHLWAAVISLVTKWQTVLGDQLNEPAIGLD